MTNAYAELYDACVKSLENNSFVKLSLSSYRGTEEDLKATDIRKIMIKGQENISFTFHYKTRDIIKNFSYAEALEKIKIALGAEYLSSTLYTIEFDMICQDGRIKKKDPSHTQIPSLKHDRKKERLIPSPGTSYLHDLKITDKNGRILDKAQDKYKQINKFIEIVETLLKEHKANKTLKIIDMGSGKGYLTFALYDYLNNIRNMDAHVIGVEYRADMVDLCNAIAEKSSFKNLSFKQGSIESYKTETADIVIALHACDTATDDAIAKAIHANAGIIMVAPCCHKQIRREIEKNKFRNDISDLTRHGIFMERQAEMITDSLRALLLEQQGYDVKVMEFISGEHTAKNIMITATKGKSRHDRAGEIQRLKSFFGIETHHLETSLLTKFL